MNAAGRETQMEWIRARKIDHSRLLPFLLEREWSCVSVTSRLKAEGFPTALAIRNRAAIYIREEPSEPGTIRELLYHSVHGMIVPVLEPVAAGSEPDRPDLAKLFSDTMPFVFSVIGLSRDVIAIERAMRRPPRHTVEYFLMTLESPAQGTADPSVDHGAATPEGIQCRRATTQDAARLFPLQGAYEREEVLLNPTSFDPASCLIQLREALRNEIVVTAEFDGRPIAKAGTNAIGYEWAQIGGVYTDRDWRGRHVARLLMRYLLAALDSEGLKACLFVKTQNEPALALYRGLGFTVRDDFRISYYG
jgi:ribosomal protein S18 acetylase RimI-like enzyme